jgi:hypothetical protein
MDHATRVEIRVRLDDLVPGLAINDHPTAGGAGLAAARARSRRGCANNVGPLILRWTDQDEA